VSWPAVERQWFAGRQARCLLKARHSTENDQRVASRSGEIAGLSQAGGSMTTTTKKTRRDLWPVADHYVHHSSGKETTDVACEAPLDCLANAKQCSDATRQFAQVTIRKSTTQSAFVGRARANGGVVHQRRPSENVDKPKIITGALTTFPTAGHRPFGDFNDGEKERQWRAARAVVNLFAITAHDISIEQTRTCVSHPSSALNDVAQRR